MSQWLIKLRSALDFDPVGALVHGCDDNAGIVELTLDHPKLVRLGRRASVVVDDCHKVVANVTFLLGALWVTLPEILISGGHYVFISAKGFILTCWASWWRHERQLA